jgi:outer membrane immunogenic protein
MKKLVLAASILSLVSGTAYTADLPVKAAPIPVATVVDWSGFYAGAQGGYHWANVHDTTVAGYIGDSTVKNGVVGGHAGFQRQFGLNQWGSFVLGVEASYNSPTEPNSVANFTPCANPAFMCGLSNIKDLWTVGARGGLAFDRFLVTASGGYASGNLARADFVPATQLFNSGGGQSLGRHDGYYVGGSLEYMFWRVAAVDVIAGIDYKHVWLNARSDRDFNGTFHTLNSTSDLVTARLSFKINPWEGSASKY